MKRLTVLAALFLALCLSGCSGPSAAYITANASRLAFAGPRLAAQATTQPAAEQQKVSDVLTSWRAEVAAQQNTPAK